MDQHTVARLMAEDLEVAYEGQGNHDNVTLALARVLGSIRMIADENDETATLALIDEVSTMAGFTD